jgi:exonuclease III
MKDIIRKTIGSLALLGLLNLTSCKQSSNLDYADEAGTNTVKIANWNLQAFGMKKSDDDQLLKRYRGVITNYDIIFIQEIRDNSDLAFRRLCENMKGYDHMISSRAGRTSSKEQYGVFYKKNIEVINFIDFNPDKGDRWERPPIEVDFKINDYTIRVYNIHTKPQKASEEIRNLEQIATNPGNNVIIGDLNASGNYYNRIKEKQFLN